MSEAISQDGIASRLTEIERRLSIMENTSRSIRSSVQDGTFEVVDGDLDPRVRLGRLDNGKYGIQVLSEDGTKNAMYADENGLDIPQISIPQNFFPDPGVPYFSIASGLGWRLVSRTIFTVLAHDAVRVLAGFGYSDTTTTAQFRLLSRKRVGGVIIAETDGPILPANVNKQQGIDWYHQLPIGVDLGAGDFYHLDVEAQVISGAGDVLTYEPVVHLESGELHGATTAGSWVVF